MTGIHNKYDCVLILPLNWPAGALNVQPLQHSPAFVLMLRVLRAAVAERDVSLAAAIQLL